MAVQTREQFFQLMRKRFQEAETAETENRQKALEDLKFVHNYDNAQWPQADQLSRAANDRPMLTNNLLRKFMRTMVGAMKQARPGIKVRPTDSQDDVLTAEIYTDLIKQVEKDIESPAEQAYDKAFEGSVGNAFGFIRIATDYEKADGFNQKLQFKRVENPFTVHFDPACANFLRTDARYCFVNTVMDKAEFKDKYPNATPGNEWQTIGESYEKWFMTDAVRVAEYFFSRPVVKEIVQLNDQSVIELNDRVTEQAVVQSGRQIVRRRRVRSNQYMWTKVSGNEILEQPRPWPGRFIPIIPTYGDEVNIEGKRVLTSFFRDAQDPQQMYNFWLTAATEIVALAPKTPYIGTAKQFKGHEKKWRDANRKNYAFLPYNADPKTKMPPQRQQPSQVPAGHVTMMNIANGNIMNTLGKYEASLGQQGNERSGKAILARRAASDMVSFGYIDNFYQSLNLAGYMMVDLIPHIYDTNRIVRLRGPEDTARFIQINMPYFDPITGQVKIAHDLTQGSFDTELDISPSYASRRQEAVESMIELIQYIPGAGPLIADLIVKNMDFPGAQEIAERLRSVAQQAQQAPPQ
jgi:hypothetical protein